MKENLYAGIIAVGSENQIGKDGKLPWKCEEDMKFFKFMTTNKNVVMGMKTFESLNYRALPKRTNYVLTRKDIGSIRYNTTKDSKVIFINDISDLPNNGKEYYIIGGSKIYELFKDLIGIWFVSKIKGDYPDCDTFVEPMWEELEFSKRIDSGSSKDMECWAYSKENLDG